MDENFSGSFPLPYSIFTRKSALNLWKPLSYSKIKIPPTYFKIKWKFRSKFIHNLMVNKNFKINSPSFLIVIIF